jgi:hypothetical protein
MSKEFNATVAAAEAVAQDKQALEEIAHSRFDAVRAQVQAQGGEHQVTETAEFHAWMAARHATDAAWGAWAMAMDAELAA